MTSIEIQNQIDLKNKELSITSYEEPKKRYKLQYQIRILQHQRDIEQLRERIKKLLD